MTDDIARKPVSSLLVVSSQHQLLVQLGLCLMMSNAGGQLHRDEEMAFAIPGNQEHAVKFWQNIAQNFSLGLGT